MINITSSQEITKIYLVTNCFGDLNKVYIGKEKTNKNKYDSRERDHKKTFGEDIIFTYIDEVKSLESKDWKPLECFWIEYFRQLGFDLQNKNGGGGGVNIQNELTKYKISIGNKGKIVSQETKLKMSQRIYSEETKLKMSLAKQNMSQETKNKISQNNKGRKYTQESKNQMSISSKGKPKSQEHRNQMSLAHKGKILSQQTKDKMSKPILQFDLDGNFIREWVSLNKASEILKLNAVGISANCKGKTKTSGKFKWKFKTTN
jgi:hypothetical protein